MGRDHSVWREVGRQIVVSIYSKRCEKLIGVTMDLGTIKGSLVFRTFRTTSMLFNWRYRIGEHRDKTRQQ